MRIEKVNVSDARELLDIYAYYVKNTAISFEYEVPSLEEFENRIRTISSKFPYIKAVVDDTIVGYAYAGDFKTRKAYEWAVETTIYVRKDCKRNGIGRALYLQLEKSLKQMGIQNMNACIGSPIVPDEVLNRDSINFHEKMGFKMVGEFEKCGYKFDRWVNMVWMQKLIGNHETNPVKVNFGNWEL